MRTNKQGQVVPNNLKEKQALEQQLNNMGVITQEQLDSLWGDLDTLHNECLALRTSPSRALILLKNAELLARVKDIPALTRAAQVLAKDIAEYTEKLNAIQAMWCQRPRTSIDTVLLGELLSIGELYSEWINSYQLVVIQSAIQVTEFFNDLNEPKVEGV